MLQRTQRFGIACPHVAAVRESFLDDFIVDIGSLRGVETLVTRRGWRHPAFAHTRADGLRLCAQLAKSPRDQLLNIIPRTQGTEAWNILRIGKVPLVFCNLDEIADRRIAGPRLPQGGTGQNRGHTLLQKGANVAARYNRFDRRQAAHIKGGCGAFCIRRIPLLRTPLGDTGGNFPGSLAIL